MDTRRTFQAGLTALAVSLAAMPSRADEPPAEPVTDVTIEMATATPGAAGGKSILRFRVVNDGHHSLTLSGVETAVAEQATLIAAADPGRPVAITSVSIPAGEVLDLTTFHLRYEIFPLRRALAQGDEFPATLNFVQFRVDIVVHVH